MNSYFCETLQDQIKCQKRLFAKGYYWNEGQKICYISEHSPVVYHFREYNKHLSYSDKYINFEETKKDYPSCIYFRTNNNNLMETE